MEEGGCNATGRLPGRVAQFELAIGDPGPIRKSTPSFHDHDCARPPFERQARRAACALPPSSLMLVLHSRPLGPSLRSPLRTYGRMFNALRLPSMTCLRPGREQRADDPIPASKAATARRLREASRRVRLPRLRLKALRRSKSRPGPCKRRWPRGARG
jgi:hypothetical protein